jgi:threonine dehydrogenase-like Zn-dependent dehydrogenase
MITEAVSVCSTDVAYFRGHLSPDAWPIIPGHEYVGRVTQIGARLSDHVEIGDRLCYWGQTDFGGMATLRAIKPLFAAAATAETVWDTGQGFYDAHQCATVKLPATVPSTMATVIEPLTSVLRALLTNPPRPGDRCVVLGCGPSGNLVIQMLRRLFGADTILAIDRSEPRLALALRSGADAGYNLSALTEDAVGTVTAEHGGIDYAVDALPHVEADPDPRELGMRLLRPGGMYVVYGATDVPQRMSTWLVLVKGLDIRAAAMDVRHFPMAKTARLIQVAANLVGAGLVDTAAVLNDYLDFKDEAGVTRMFANYGFDNRMKTALLVN